MFLAQHSQFHFPNSNFLHDKPSSSIVFTIVIHWSSYELESFHLLLLTLILLLEIGIFNLPKKI